MPLQPDPVQDVIVVGAGPAGIGVAAALTPSFTSNQFGLVDLNAITPYTSPALSLLEEHPTGPDYAAYLEMVAKLHELDVVTGIEVVDVRPAADGLLEVVPSGTAQCAVLSTRS